MRVFTNCSYFYTSYLSNVFSGRHKLEKKEKAMSIGHNFTGPLAYFIVQSRKRDKLDTILKVVFLSLQLVDFVLTMLAARFGWLELNPLLQGSPDFVTKLAIFKFAIPVLISWFVPGRWLIPAILLLVGVVGWNVAGLIMLA
jgi:hypothetical protein